MHACGAHECTKGVYILVEGQNSKNIYIDIGYLSYVLETLLGIPKSYIFIIDYKESNSQVGINLYMVGFDVG